MAESRKVVTIVFADVTGSTALGEQLDPETMRRVMERYFAEMRAVLERHGGTVEKFIGDAVMAVFGIPTVHEDDALRAVRAAAEMRDRLALLNHELRAERGVELAVRTGVNTGEVVAGDAAEGQAFATGDAVNVAARLEQATQPGEILIGPLTHRLVGDAVRSESVEPLELKGKSEAVEAWRLVEVLPEVPAYTRRIDAPFVGREAELAVLRSAYERARDSGACELVTVTGAPGIGKSRLVRELVASVRHEARVVVGRCLSYGEGITYWPLAEIVREVAGSDPRAGLRELLGSDGDADVASKRLLGAIGASDEAARTEEIFWATRMLLERLARERPLIAVVDDIHWAEPTLLDLLEYLVGFAKGSILLACTARSELYDARPQWSRAGAVELDALEESDAHALIAALLEETDLDPGMRETIRERAEGNPLFVEQMLALAAENGNGELAVPATIQALLAARLDHLSPQERAVLVRGAVEGRLFHRGAVSALLPDEDRDQGPGLLLNLARKSFVRPDDSFFAGDDAFRFVHVLMRDAAYETAPKELRADLHERYAAWLEDRAPQLDEIVGYHLDQSYRYRQELGEAADELARRAGDRLAAAGERAARRGDHKATADVLGRAYTLLGPGVQRLQFAASLGRALYESGRIEDAVRLYSAAITEARELELETLALRSELELNRLKLQSDPSWALDGAVTLAESAIPVLSDSGDHVGLTLAFALIHDVEWMRGRLRASQRTGEQALEHARRLGDVSLIARAIEGSSAARWFADAPLDEMKPTLEQSLAWAREVGHRALEANTLYALGWAAMEQGAHEEGLRQCEQGITQLEELGLSIHAAGQRSHLRWGELAREPAAVEARMTRAYEALNAAGETGLLSTVAANLAMLYARSDRLAEAARLAEESRVLGSPDDVVTQVGWRMATAVVFARQGRIGDAESVARDAQARALASEYADLRAIAHLVLADVLSRAGRPDEAVEAVETGMGIFEAKGMADSAAAARAQLAEIGAQVGSAPA